MGAEIGLFLGWENGIGVTGTGIWPLGMGNESLKMGMGLRYCQLISNFLHLLNLSQIENFI